MRLLFGYAHTSPDSFTTGCRVAAVATTKAKGHTTKLVDSTPRTSNPALPPTTGSPIQTQIPVPETLAPHTEALHFA